jgi:hypothetical protein
MRKMSFSVAILLALLPSAAPAQQSPGTSDDKATGDTIGHPPPLPGPPPLSAPAAPQSAPAAASAPHAGESAPKGYTGAYAPSGPPPIPNAAAPLPQSSQGSGLSKVGPDGSTRTVKAVPCGVTARETDGFTTCVGIPDQNSRRRR